jgi:Family of unknown function (DUF6527)
MRKEIVLKHEFVEFIPDDLKEGTIYVSIRFATVSHKCCCGCGNKVVTPLRPTDWKLIFDGKTISLHPSIGNWGFECRSHYWIKNNRVQWAAQWSQEEIRAGRAHDSLAKEEYFNAAKNPAAPVPPAAPAKNASVGEPGEGKPKEGFWQWLKKWCGFGSK